MSRFCPRLRGQVILFAPAVVLTLAASSSWRVCSLGAEIGNAEQGCHDRTGAVSMLQVHAALHGRPGLDELSENSKNQVLADVKEIAPGVSMPKVLLGMGGPLYGPLHAGGSVGLEAHQRAEAMAELWLSVGGRGLDTAQAYLDEMQAGNAVRQSGLPREEVFLLTKLAFGPTLSEGDTTAMVTKSLQAIGVDYLDLMLIHVPGSREANAMAWKELEDLVSAGKLRSIGVSNFDAAQMQALLDIARIPIALNQRSLNVLEKDDDNLNFCLEHGITYQAYTPLGEGGSVFSNRVINKIAEVHGKSAAQVALRWVLERGAVLSVQSESKEHQLEDLDLFSWALTSEDMSDLDSL